MVYGQQEHWKTLPESTPPIAMETKYGDERKKNELGFI